LVENTTFVRDYFESTISKIVFSEMVFSENGVFGNGVFGNGVFEQRNTRRREQKNYHPLVDNVDSVLKALNWLLGTLGLYLNLGRSTLSCSFPVFYRVLRCCWPLPLAHQDKGE
jgi:hypothetical protein